jgi:hypothetical protein
MRLALPQLPLSVAVAKRAGCVFELSLGKKPGVGTENKSPTTVAVKMPSTGGRMVLLTLNTTLEKVMVSLRKSEDQTAEY